MHTDACHSVPQIILSTAVPVLARRSTSQVLLALVTVSPRSLLAACVLEVLSHHLCCATKKFLEGWQSPANSAGLGMRCVHDSVSTAGPGSNDTTKLVYCGFKSHVRQDGSAELTSSTQESVLCLWVTWSCAQTVLNSWQRSKTD